MVEIYQFGDDLKALNNKRYELETKGFKFVRDVKDDNEGQNIIDGVKTALLDVGAYVVILKTRGLIDIWSKKSDQEEADGYL
jgi:hypothetical protein